MKIDADSSYLEVEDENVFRVRTTAEGPQGSLDLSDEMLRHWPSV